MKLLYDFFPIFLFFIVYKLGGIYAATVAAIIVSLLQVGIYWCRHRQFEQMQVITLMLILVLGSLTLFLHNEIFIKWKPTLINWLFALGFFLSQYIGKKPFIRRLLDKNVALPPGVWQKLNIAWVAFFLLTGALNLFVVYHFSTNAWVNFKLFGMLTLTLVFVVLQALYLTRYLDNDSKKS